MNHYDYEDPNRSFWYVFFLCNGQESLQGINLQDKKDEKHEGKLIRKNPKMKSVHLLRTCRGNAGKFCV